VKRGFPAKDPREESVMTDTAATSAKSLSKKTFNAFRDNLIKERK